MQSESIQYLVGSHGWIAKRQRLLAHGLHYGLSVSRKQSLQELIGMLGRDGVRRQSRRRKVADM
jgi:hypothetical protein